MKAARFYEKHKLVVEDVPIRELEPDEVLVKIRYCGICGTDVHIFEGDEGSVEVTPPTTLGHEFSGDIAEVGSAVRKLKTGDRVSVDPNASCDMCYFCANGRKHLCKDMVGIGTAADGGFAEYIIVKEHLAFVIPDSVSYESAAMIEPISCCLHGAELTGVELGDTVMVVGTGNIGLIMIQLVKYMGASKIIAVEPSEIRRERAKHYGAHIAVHPDEDLSKILEEQNIANIDKVIDCAGLTVTAEYALKYAGKGATIMLFGLTGPNDRIEIMPFDLFKRELTIKASFVNPYAYERSVRLLESGIVNVDEIITDIVELDDIQSVFENRLYSKNGKVLIKTF